MKIDFKTIKRDTLAGVLLHFGLAIACLLLLAFMYFYVYLPSSTNHGETITVPDIEGKSLEDLKSELEDRLLRFEVSDSSYSDRHPPLSVLKQYPHAGSKVKEGRIIYVTVNRVQPPSVPVPNLIDGSVVNADALLKSNQLKRGSIRLVKGPFNTIKEMVYKGSKITPGTRVPKGSTIDLIVTDGGGTEITVSDYRNMSLEDAKVSILGNNLAVGRINLFGDTTNGVIIQQIPEPGETAKVGDAVELWIGQPGATIDQQTDDPENDPDQ